MPSLISFGRQFGLEKTEKKKALKKESVVLLTLLKGLGIVG
tara:strand:- start:79 stop:201 length:123 start_codon:yes stop_codon:yes gene_type:complete